MALRLASPFSDHAVLQRGVPVPIWGWAEPGAEVSIRFDPGAGSGDAGQTRTTRAGPDGRWRVTLDPLGASAAPARLAVESRPGGSAREVRDILVGEVWLASGQSNMEWTVRDSLDAAAEIAAAKHPAIREFTVPRATRMSPPDDAGGCWAVCAPEAVGDFSAVAYFFGRELHGRENVPIGLVNSSWGGTRVEAWTSRAALAADELCRAEVERYEATLRSIDPEARRKALEEYQADPDAWLRRHVPADPGDLGFGRGWAAPAFDDSGWPEMELPATWQSRGVPGNGVVWFRRAVEVPAAWAGRDLVLHLGACDKHDTTWFNNEPAGATGWETPNAWCFCRAYRIPGRLVRAGRNVLAVRVYSYRNAGGVVGPAAEMHLEPAEPDGSAPIPIAGRWRYAVEHDFGVIRDTEGCPELLPNQNSPYALFENMIAPLVPYALRGFIWYQGESNAAEPQLYRQRFPALIRDWRRAWGGANLPFIFVQLANYVSDGKWPWLREAQTLALAEPATAMAVALDIGDPEDVHPRNKREVGRRLALAAESLVYGRELVSSGPLYRSHEVKGEVLQVRFNHVGGGLAAKGGGRLLGFAVAGKNKKFVEAEAAIEGDAVLVRAAGVKRPEAVRYAWADNPTCNLCNREGLPASPFRTDEW